MIDQKSIQFSTENNCDLVSISTEMDYLSNHHSNTRISKITDSLTIIEDIQSDLKNEKAAYQSEKKLLEKNNSIKGSQQNLSVEELSNMATFYRKRMMELNKKISTEPKLPLIPCFTY